MITLDAVRRFFEELEFVKVTDFANSLKFRHNNGKKRK
jgi:hypothetical protein